MSGELGDLNGPGPRVQKWLRILFAFWLLLAVALTVVREWRQLDSYLADEWISAHFMTSGRVYAELGIWKIGFAPVVNYPPFEHHPIAYIHWPPLYSWLLGGIYAVFGSTEAVTHALMLLVHLATAFLLFQLAMFSYGKIAAFVSATCWLTAPVSIIYSHHASNLHLAILIELAALLCFCRSLRNNSRWNWCVACLLQGLAVLVSWEPFFAPLGLLALSVLTGDRHLRRKAPILLSTGVASATFVIGIYCLEHPYQFKELGEVLLFRMGLIPRYSSNPLGAPELQFVGPSLIQIVTHCLQNYSTMLGLVPLLVATWFWLCQAENAMFGKLKVEASSPLWALLSMAAFWQVFFWSHLYIHTIEAVVLLPAVALGVGGLAEQGVLELASRQPEPYLRVSIIAVALPCLLLVPAIHGARSAGKLNTNIVSSVILSSSQVSRPGFDQLVCAGMELERLVPSDGVIVTDMKSAVPLYYSRRHMIRGVVGDAGLDMIRPAIQQQLGGYPLYLALSPNAVSKFSRSLSSAVPISSSECVVAARLN